MKYHNKFVCYIEIYYVCINEKEQERYDVGGTG